MKLNPSEVIQDTTSIDAFLDYLDPFLVPQSIQQQLPPSDVVGNIRFSHPTLYVFPGGQGDSALFGINGFNLLVDGGFSRKACFWDFSRHLDRLDAILITRISDDNAGGMSALLQRKTMSAVYPQIGHVFANLPQTEKCNELGKSEEQQEEDEDSLLINVIEEGNAMLQNLQILNLQPQVCLRDRDNAFKPINLYHKVGHGKLDMYVINPSKDAKEIREFMERWNGENSKTLGTFKSGINVDGKELWLPLANLVSICALLVWFPDNPDDTITRLLFPGSTPQNKVLRGLDKLKELEFMQKPVCASRSMRQTVQPSASDKKDAMKQAMRMTAGSRASRETQSVKAEKTDLSAKKSTTSLRSERKPTTESKTASKKFEDKTPRSPKRKPEDKAQKERRNQAAGQQIKEKASSVLKREKPLTSVRSSAKSGAGAEKVASSRKSAASKTGLPPSKTKKEASNKTKKEEVTKSLKSRKKSSTATNGVVAEQPSAAPATDENKEDQNGDMNGHVSPTKSVMAGLAAVVSTATCAAAMVMTEPIQQLEEEVESIVEKHQIEEMERTSNAPKETEDDDIEPELQRIKDDEDVHEQEAREPDIPVAALPIEEKLPEIPLVAKPVQQAATTHVKTPDEVEDLPEHEAVEPEVSQDAEELSPAEEKKIALDLKEKETVEEKEIAEEVQEIVLEQVQASEQPQVQSAEEAVEESEGAQEQRELSEVIVSAQQEAMPAEQEPEFKEHIDKLTSVLNSIIAIYEEESKSSKSINNESLQNDIGDHLEKCIKLLNSLTYNSPPSTEELFNTKRACNSTVELVRKCMKLAIELIEAESEGATSFMEHLHSEPDLILHCQEIEDFCDARLPKDAVEAMSVAEQVKNTKEENDGEDKETNEAVENEPGMIYLIHYFKCFKYFFI